MANTKQTKRAAVLNNNRHEEVGFFAVTADMAPDACSCPIPAEHRNRGPICICCGSPQVFRA